MHDPSNGLRRSIPRGADWAEYTKAFILQWQPIVDVPVPVGWAGGAFDLEPRTNIGEPTKQLRYNKWQLYRYVGVHPEKDHSVSGLWEAVTIHLPVNHEGNDRPPPGWGP